ncbi:cytochrome c oxidase assembly factor 1 homolog [Montipora capricornis]|uniref:cytochrome c oxidase assembly factor 1 homolog n=1 Tax=Montipora capricornis TaxID=246305 RepID=UPI0035F11AC1
MVNADSLKKIAICGAAISCLGAAFFHHRIQANIASQDYYKKSVEALRGHRLASDTIGKPIRIPYLNLARNDIRVNHRTAQVVIPVRGSKASGNLYSFATRKKEEGWVLERVELEVGPECNRIKILPAE